MTVAELIDKLRLLPSKLPVTDCMGDEIEEITQEDDEDGPFIMLGT